MGIPPGRSMTAGASPTPTVSVFTFEVGAPVPQLTFSLPTCTTTPRKRFRPVADVDGEHSSGQHKKKRRLRLLLITSRLSLPFSQPASNIVNRGSSKIALWAKQKSSGRNLLRKAAIINRVRHCQAKLPSTSNLPVTSQAQEEVRQTFLYGSPDTFTHPVIQTTDPSQPVVLSPNFTTPPALVRGPTVERETPDDTPLPSKQQAPSPHVPRRDYIPLPPSPLGLSNYDALDSEDDFDDEDGVCDWSFGGGDGGDTEEVERLGPAEPVTDDHDSIEAFASPETTALMNIPPPIGRAYDVAYEARMLKSDGDLPKEERQRVYAFVRLEH